MKTTIVIEDGRVTVQVDDNQPVVVKPSPVEKSELMPAPIKSVDEKKPEPPIASPPAELSTTSKKNLEVVDNHCINCGDPLKRGAKYCKKPECKKAQTKAGNDRYRAKKGGNVGVGRGRRPKHNDPGQFELQEREKVPPLWEDAPPAEPIYRSNCHDAAVRVAGGEDEPDEGGTRFYVCQACQNACDVHELPFEDPWDCNACRINGRLCRLHHSMESEGKKAPAVRHQI